MAAPTVHPITQRTYEQIPLAYRDADEKLDWPLLRWLSLLCDQIGEVTDALDAIDVLTPDEGGAPGATSALTDPATAEAAWLPWLGQFVGLATLPADVTEARTAIRDRSFTRGTKASIIAAAKRYLIPGASVTITERVGDRWHYTVHAYTDQVTDAAGLAAAVAAENPAGMVQTLSITGGTYADLMASSASYSALRSNFANYAALRDYTP